MVFFIVSHIVNAGQTLNHFHLVTATRKGRSGYVIKAISLVASDAADLDNQLAAHEAGDSRANVAVIFVGENICDATILQPLLKRGIR